ncbi:MAG: c-type cytochrome [Candidatus Kapaibacterium sp.]
MLLRHALGVILIGIISFNNALSSDGETLFKVCSACHTIGGGKIVGPDLKGISDKRSDEWLIKFIQNSTEFIQSGDADAIAIFEENNRIPMPAQALSDAQVKSIIAYIDSKSVDAGDGGEATPAVKITYLEREINDGAKLFSGEMRLKNGGASCISCHNVKYDKFMSGGGLAKDLTEAKTRITDAGIRGMIGSPGFPAMIEAYKNNKITEDEVKSLTAFLVHVDEEKDNHEGGNSAATLLMGGFGGLFVLFIILAMLRTKVKAKSVNQAIYDRQIKSIN